MTDRVVIVGGGVAGLEVLLALRALAGDRVDITVVAPERKFVNRSMSVTQPFMRQRARGIVLEKTATEFGAQLHPGTVGRVDPECRTVITTDRTELHYDTLVLALGARADHVWQSAHALTYQGGQDGPRYRMLLRNLIEARCDRVAFVRPPGASWPLPLYDLALLTAAYCASHERPEVELSLITPEREPLGMFGSTVSADVRRLLNASGIALHTNSEAIADRVPWLDIVPGPRRVRIDHVVTAPRLAGPRLRGIPCGPDGFIDTDAHGRVDGLHDVFAAGDATAFPIKQGGLAAQQADAVAETIAASVGVQINPQPFRPVLRGILLTGGSPRYLHANISGGGRDSSSVSEEPLWWPPDKLAGRYLGPYLSRQLGDASDVMPQDGQMNDVDTAVAPAARDPQDDFEELRDLAPSRHATA